LPGTNALALTTVKSFITLAPDVLIEEGRDLAGVDPGQVQGGFLEQQSPVAFVAVGVNAVVDVDVFPEPVPDDLGLGHLARNPLEEGGGFPVEVPLDVLVSILEKLFFPSSLRVKCLGATTLNIMTFGITTLNVMTFGIMTLSIMTLSIMKLSIIKNKMWHSA
jgi:hypothetical protein